MACKKALKMMKNNDNKGGEQLVITSLPNETLYMFFGVDSTSKSDMILQNNLTLFEWVVRNQSHPYFWGRNIVGDNALTKSEVDFLNNNGCKVIPIYNNIQKSNKTTQEEGMLDANNTINIISKLGITSGETLYLQIEPSANLTAEYMLGYAKTIVDNGYTPGFFANTDSLYDFDRQFCRSYQTNSELFGLCKIWAKSPTKPEFYGTNNAHTTLPDYWEPYCPSCITKEDISIWRYGERCHPIRDNIGNSVSVNYSAAKNLENFFSLKKFDLENLNIDSKNSGSFDVTFTAHTIFESYTVSFNCNLIKVDSNSMLMKNKVVSKINSSNYTVLNFSITKGRDILYPEYEVDDGYALIKLAYVSDNSTNVIVIREVINLSEYPNINKYFNEISDSFEFTDLEKNDALSTEFWEIPFHKQNTNKSIKSK